VPTVDRFVNPTEPPRDDAKCTGGRRDGKAVDQQNQPTRSRYPSQERFEEQDVDEEELSDAISWTRSHIFLL